MSPVNTELTPEEIVQLNKDHVLFSWSAQAGLSPLPMVRGDGVFIYDAHGKRYFDFSAQLMCTNLGHGHPRVIRAVQEQLERYSFFYPGHAHEAKGRLAQLLCEICPGDMQKVFFTLGGAEAIENAVKIARQYSGRHKILARYRSYHGATHGASAVSGDPRRFATEPSGNGVVHFYGPYPYRCPFGSENDEECRERSLAHLEQTLLFEDPASVAAIVLEGVSGSSGLILYPDGYMEGVRALCDKYGILLIADEVMSGFGRTGEWFGMEHYDAAPDIITMAKGLTSSYEPLGAEAVSQAISKHFDDHPLVAGLTYSGHPVGCAAGIAVIEAYREEGVLEHVRAMGKLQDELLAEMKAEHPSVGDVRNKGLFGVLELVRDRATREPLTPWNATGTDLAPSNAINARLRELGLTTFVRWSWIFCVPPLPISEAELREAFGIIDQALEIADEHYAG